MVVDRQLLEGGGDAEHAVDEVEATLVARPVGRHLAAGGEQHEAGAVVGGLGGDVLGGGAHRLEGGDRLGLDAQHLGDGPGVGDDRLEERSRAPAHRVVDGGGDLGEVGHDGGGAATGDDQVGAEGVDRLEVGLEEGADVLDARVGVEVGRQRRAEREAHDTVAEAEGVDGVEGGEVHHHDRGGVVGSGHRGARVGGHLDLGRHLLGGGLVGGVVCLSSVGGVGLSDVGFVSRLGVGGFGGGGVGRLGLGRRSVVARAAGGGREGEGGEQREQPQETVDGHDPPWDRATGAARCKATLSIECQQSSP